MQVGGGDKVRPALSLVGYEEDLRPAMAFVFGSTFVCDTLKIAKQVLSPRSSPVRPSFSLVSTHDVTCTHY